MITRTNCATRIVIELDGPPPSECAGVIMLDFNQPADETLPQNIADFLGTRCVSRFATMQAAMEFMVSYPAVAEACLVVARE